MSDSLDIGFKFVGYNERRPPFDDLHFRQALSAAIDRDTLAADAWGDAAVPANSWISPALRFWAVPNIVAQIPGKDLEGAKKILKDAGYVVVDGKLHYPPGVKETTTPYQ